MVSVTLYTTKEFESFLACEYKPGKDECDIIKDSAKEIMSFFKNEGKGSWMVVDYRGVPQKILPHLELFSVKYVRRYYLQVIIPETAGLELPQTVVNEVQRFNMGNIEDSIINLKYDKTLKAEEVGFRLIFPKYTYADML